MLKPGNDAQISRLEEAMETERFCHGADDRGYNEDMEARGNQCQCNLKGQHVQGLGRV